MRQTIFIAAILYVASIAAAEDSNELCTCGTVKEAAEDPFCPVTYRPDMNEFNMVWTNNQGWTYSRILSYCWSCGKKLTHSTRGDLWHKVSPEEKDRIKELLKPYGTFTELKKKFGEPDYVVKRGYMIGKLWDPNAKKEEYRGPTWQSLSKVADVLVEINDDGTVRKIDFYPKKKKAASKKATSDHGK